MTASQTSGLGCQFKDLTGMTFADLTVLGEFCRRKTRHRKHPEPWWKCLCVCGNGVFVRGTYLRAGVTKRCRACGNSLCGGGGRTHGKTLSAEYRLWHHMVSRCHNPADKSYPRYGGRGITVCPAWRRFENFFQDMGERPTPRHELDRYPDNNGAYRPGNCRWATRLQQAGNKRNNQKLTYRGETKCVAAWARELGVSYRRFYQRVVVYGWSVEAAVAREPWKRTYDIAATPEF